MEFTIESNKTELVIKMIGKFDLDSAMEFEPKIKDILDQQGDKINELVFDFSQVTFIASYGLRVILELYKKMQSNNGSLKIKGVSEDIKKSFNLVGFNKLLTLE